MTTDEHAVTGMQRELQALRARVHKLEMRARFLLEYNGDVLSHSFLCRPLDIGTERAGALPDYLSIAAIIYNEGRNLREWLEFHLLMGADRFYLYDNGSTDDTRQILEPYIAAGTVVYRLVTGRAMQLPVYNDAICQAYNRSHWLALIDLDEMLVPVQADSVAELLRDYEEHAALGVNWVTFDSNGHEHRPTAGGGLAIANYTTVHHDAHDREHGVRTIKTILNPRKVLLMTHVHYARYQNNELTVSENHEPFPGHDTPYHSSAKIQLNHYYTRSREEYELKLSVRRADTGELRAFRGNNLIFPDPAEERTVLRFLPQLRARLGLPPDP